MGGHMGAPMSGQMGMLPETTMTAQAGMGGMFPGQSMPGAAPSFGPGQMNTQMGGQMNSFEPQTQMNPMGGQMQTMMPGSGGMNPQEDQLAQQIRETERQMAEMQEKIQMAQMSLQGQAPATMMPSSMASPGFGGGGGGIGGDMGGVGYGGAMGSGAAAGGDWEDQSDSGSENDWWNQPASYGQGAQGGVDPYATQPGFQGGMPGSMDPYATQPGFQGGPGGMQSGMNYGGGPQMGMGAGPPMPGMMAGGGGPQQYGGGWG